MEVTQTLTLNEVALQQLPDDKKPLFIFEWLRFLDKVLVAAQKSDIKSCQQKLVAQLVGLLRENLGAPARRLLAGCLATLFSVGDTFLLFDTVNKCNDIIKVKDDSPSYLPTRLAAICCLGSMYEKLGRMMGRSYEETVSTLVRSLKSSESQARLEIMNTLEKICVGMGTAAPIALREVSRASRTSLLSERSTAVRAAAAHCLRHMLPLMKLTPSDVDSIAHACLRGAHPTDYNVRCAVAELLGALIAATQANEATNLNSKPKFGQSVQQTKKEPQKNVISLDEALNVLMSAFLRGGSSFLKGEIIKSGSSGNREVRVCVTNAYVLFVQNMGGVWLERNMTTFLTHVLDLVANPKAASSHVDAVYSRKCINYILRNTLGKILGEKAEASACKEIIQIVVKQMNSIDFNPENAKDCNQETLFSQHLLVCALTEAGELALQLGTSVQNLIADNSLNMINAICSVLEHPCVAARLAAAHCLRCICVALPSQITPLLDRCLLALEQTLHISGYAAAVAAILGSVRHSPLGIPHGRGKVAFNTAEQLLRSAGQSSRFTSAKTNAGWLIVGAICTLGTPVVRGLLPRMLLLWRNSFPRSAKELESEKARGDSFTWQVHSYLHPPVHLFSQMDNSKTVKNNANVTLEGRAGALSALHSLLIHCPSLCAEDTKRLAQPIEGAVAVLANVGEVARSSGGVLKAPLALLRARTYQCCGLARASAPPALLRLVAAELVGGTEQVAVATGLIRSAMHPRDTILLDDVSWIYDTDHADIEEQLILPLSASGSNALEHDPCSLYHAKCTGAQPLGVAVLDAAVTLFPHLFSRANHKHRQQLLEHFTECIKMSKGPRQEAIQMNVYTAMSLALKTLAETKSSLGPEGVKNLAIELIINGLSANSLVVRALAASCVSRLSPCVSETESQTIYEKVSSLVHSSNNNNIRAAGAVALSGLARGAGALALLRHLAQDHSCTLLQVWSVHALSVLVDTAGPMFRSHVDATLNLALKLLFTAPPYLELLHRCIGRLISALITVVGPELQGSSIAGRFSMACAALCGAGAGAGAGAARAEALGCLQQLHMFAPMHIHLTTLLDSLCRDLSSPELVVRRAALACLRQLSQKEANEVCKHALSAKDHVPARPYCGVVITESGLPAALFALLDTERDEDILSYTRDTITCCLLSSQSIKEWLLLCKRVLTIRQDDSGSSEVDFEAEGDDDHAEFHAETEQSTHPAVQPRWPTRVFAMECIQKLMSACEASGEPAHFDLVLAKEKLETNPNGDYLSLHLPELILVSLVCATGEADAARMRGLRALQRAVSLFAKAPEPGFPDHLLLEQYQAQVGAALRPAFTGETASHVTAAAGDVCSAWLAAAAAAPHLGVRRVHQLLVSGLDKLNTKGNTTLIYNESMATLEKLSILKAWAEVYIVAMISNGTAPGSYVKQLNTKQINNQMELTKWRNLLQNNTNQIDNATLETSDDDFGDFESKGESLLKLVDPELENLGAFWLAALKDHALLSLPPEFSSQLPHGGGAFYAAATAAAARAHYAACWPSLLYAAALRYHAPAHDNSVDNKTTKNENEHGEFLDPTDERFHLLFGICMEALCAQRDMSVENTVSVLLSLVTLLDAPQNRARLLKDRALAVELCQVIHRTALTIESVEALLLAVDALKLVIQGAREQLDSNIEAKIKELTPAEATSTPQSVLEVVHTLGEGGPTGDLPPNKSLVFTALEVALCFLVRRVPELSPVKQEGKVGVIGVRKGLGVHGDTMFVKACMCLGELPALTSPQGALSILPTIIYLSVNALRHSKGNATICEAATLLLQQAADCKNVRVMEETRTQFDTVLHSALTHMLDLVKNGSPEGESGESGERSEEVEAVWGAAAISVLTRGAAASLLCVAINHFRRLLDTCDSQKFAALCPIVGRIWSSEKGARVSWWARALAPVLLARALDRSHENCTSTNAAAFTALACLVESAPETARETHKGVQLLWLLVPLVCGAVLPVSGLSRASATARQRHHFALRWLAHIGPLYPQEFKTMMQQSPELRSKLESAVKASQHSQSRPQRRVTQEQTIAKPTIQLKTDFSDFR